MKLRPFRARAQVLAYADQVVQWGEDQEPAELPDFVDDDEAAGGGGGPPDSFGFGRAAS